MCAFRVDLDGALARLRAGDIVAMPTETVYGLAGDARNEAALRRIYALKGRPASNPLIVHLASAAAAREWAREVTPAVQALLDTFWPGPLTVVLPALPAVSRLVTAGGDSVALRVPAHPLALELLQAFGGAVCAPSANKSGYVSPTSAQHVLDDYAGDDVAVLDGGECPRGIESTIVRPVGDVLQILRPGTISLTTLRAGWGGAVEVIAKPEIAVPGSAPRHYAPRTPTQIVERVALRELTADAAVIFIGEAPANCTAGRCVVLPRDPEEYAARIYATLRELDAGGFLHILIERLPDDEDWLALANRLGRASTHE